MKNTIYNVYVEMESQEQCDRMKQLCIDNGLDLFTIFFSLWYKISKNNVFGFDKNTGKFAIHELCKHETKVTEQEFINLLK